MRFDEILGKVRRELNNTYQFRNGQWLYRETTGWKPTPQPPRIQIWNVIGGLKHAGVIPSQSLANAIQQGLETLPN
jgi:hypothetical protein